MIASQEPEVPLQNQYPPSQLQANVDRYGSEYGYETAANGLHSGHMGDHTSHGREHDSTISSNDAVQKSSIKQLVNHVFPKLAVYHSVDPSLAPSLLMLNQQCDDRIVHRYVYYYLARILSNTGSQENCTQPHLCQFVSYDLILSRFQIYGDAEQSSTTILECSSGAVGYVREEAVRCHL